MTFQAVVLVLVLVVSSATLGTLLWSLHENIRALTRATYPSSDQQHPVVSTELLACVLASFKQEANLDSLENLNDMSEVRGR